MMAGRFTVHITLVVTMIIVCSALEWRSVTASEQQGLLLRFDSPEKVKQWQNVDDVVMGGVSRSQFAVTPNKTALFSGKVSLENYGGFASVFSRLTDSDLSSYQGIEIRVKSDSKRYKIYLKNDPTLDSKSYEVRLNTEKDAWKTIRVPFSSLNPMFRGQMVADAPKFNPRDVKSIGIVISEKQEGSFQLEIEYITVY
jgi:monofunctional biosynthetic peptidoglycan transglycosylase